MAATKAVDGVQRDSRGNLKFNRNTKKAREEEREMVLDDEDAGQGGNGGKGKLEDRRKKRKAMGLGEEFRAKVSPYTRESCHFVVLQSVMVGSRC